MSELWHWIERIGGGLAGLVILGALLVYVPVFLRWLWRLFGRGCVALWRALWCFPSTLAKFRNDPWRSLQRWSDQSTLFTLAIYPLILVLDKVRSAPRRNAALDPDPVGRGGLPADLADKFGELTLHGIAVLAETVHGFCAQNRYPLWRFGGENHDPSTIAAWHQALIAALAPWAQIRVHVEEFEASWGPVARVYLSEGEWRCSASCLRRPARHPWTLALRNKTALPIDRAQTSAGHALRLLDLLQTRHGVDALIDRLNVKCVGPYAAIDVPPLADEAARNRKLWTWANGEMHPLALAWPKLSAFLDDPEKPAPVLIPRSWGSVEKSCGWLGPLHLGADHTIIVSDASGQSGILLLIDLRDAVLGEVVGYWLQTCRWPYLRGGYAATGGPVFEAAQSLVPNAHGEIVGDLIDGVTGARLNPDGVKILAGTLDREGGIAISDGVDADSPRRVDRINLAGELMHGAKALRWANLHADSEGYRPVQCPSSGRWGFIDRDGAIAIDPQFADVGHFHQSKARAWPDQARGLLGLIDTRGAWAVAPQWRRIEAQTRRFFVVQDGAGDWGAVDGHGELIVALKPREIWKQSPGFSEILEQRPDKLDKLDKLDKADESDEREAEVLIETVAREWHEAIRKKVRAALETPPYTLAGLDGVFDGDATQKDLRQAGLWGLKVRVLRDQSETILQPRAGEEGWLRSHYPVGLSCFDLSAEAPVCGLAAQPEAVLGVAWKDLAAVAARPHSDND